MIRVTFAMMMVSIGCALSTASWSHEWPVNAWMNAAAIALNLAALALCVMNVVRLIREGKAR